MSLIPLSSFRRKLFKSLPVGWMLATALVISCAVVVGAGALVITTPAAKADECFIYSRHWGEEAPRRWQARINAIRGLKWKQRALLRATPAGRLRIHGCKIRSSGYWQCEAGQRVDACI